MMAWLVTMNTGIRRAANRASADVTPGRKTNSLHRVTCVTRRALMTPSRSRKSACGSSPIGGRCWKGMVSMGDYLPQIETDSVLNDEVRILDLRHHKTGHM